MRSSQRYFRVGPLVAAMALSASVDCVVALAQTRPAWADVGTSMTPEDIKAMPMDTGPSGKDLPPGSGTAKQGAQIYASKCVMCHGVDMKGYTAPAGSGLVAGGGSLVAGKDIPLWGKDGPNGGISRTWYAKYPTVIWNAVAVDMPAYNAGSLTPDEVYALVALILAKNEIIKEDMVLNKDNLAKVEMPRRNDYLPAKDEDIANIMKRGCYKTFAICEPMAVPEGSFKPPAAAQKK